MDYSNIIYIAKYLYVLTLLTIALISGILIMFSLLQLISQRYNDLYQYKVTNFYISSFLGSIYIILFILLLYSLRLYNVNHILDIWEMYLNLTILYHNIKDLSLFLQSYIVVLCILFVFIIMLTIIFIQKRLVHHIIIFDLFSQNIQKYLCDKYRYIQKIKSTLTILAFGPIILYPLRKIIIKLVDFHYKGKEKYNELPISNPYRVINRFLHSKKADKLVIMSPFFFVVYDCVFNNYIISHVFQYLLLYIPIMLFYRLNTYMLTKSGPIYRLLWNIYYVEKEEGINVKDSGCIYALSEQDKRILEIYLLNELRHDVDIGLDMEMYIENSIRFVQSTEEDPNVYTNYQVYLRITEDNRLYREIETDRETGNIIKDGNITYPEIVTETTLEEEWILLADKRNNKKEVNYYSSEMTTFLTICCIMPVMCIYTMLIYGLIELVINLSNNFI